MQRPAGAPGRIADVAQQARRMADRFQIGIRLTARPHAIKKPPPRAVETSRIERPQRRGAKPKVVIDPRRRIAVWRLADRALLAALPGFGKPHLAQRSRL